MNVALNKNSSPTEMLSDEWERLQFLGYCMSQARQGIDISEKELKTLETIQGRVESIRESGVWQSLLSIDLNPMELDVLACVVAPEIEPRIGWMYQSLQPGQNAPYPSKALIHELLALSHKQVESLHWALSPGSMLRRHHLIRVDQEDIYQPVKPDSRFTMMILGQGYEQAPPPFSISVPLKVGWDDIVLSSGRKRMLKEYLLWIRHSDKVVNDWGGEFTGGPLALFSGPSGTGKTLAASVVANELGWSLFRVDLSRLVSKYIGETEKNLSELFDAADRQPMVLQFDEADALFSKRGEVKEARDRYANMEVSHLLSRIETHSGPCILTTNLRKQIDSAFTRRFQVVIDFPRPDVEDRAKLWEKLLPPNAPLDDEIEPELLASAANITGGSIRNAALHAAYLAADDGTSINLTHIAVAVWREVSKKNHHAAHHELGVLKEYLPENLDD